MRDNKDRRVGRPARYGEAMIQKTIRLPRTWIKRLIDEFGTFQLAIETIVKEHCENKETKH